MARALLATDWTTAAMIDMARRVLALDSGPGPGGGADEPATADNAPDNALDNAPDNAPDNDRTPFDPARHTVRAVRRAYPEAPRDRARELAAFLLARGLADVRGPLAAPRSEPVLRRVTAVSATMLRNRWGVPVIHDRSMLAQWLEVTPAELRWFADVRGMNRDAADGALHHYRTRWVPKANGGVRLIEAPKPRLRGIQRHLLRELVLLIPIDDAAHGFVSGRSALTAALPHCGQRVLLRFDLEDFFASITPGRVFALLRSCGHPESVAHSLTGLVAVATPQDVIASRSGDLGARTRERLRIPHLPQGAPTSPALANACARSLDRRITALAARFGAQYTRYADDLFLSGGRALLGGVGAVCDAVRTIALAEGFRIRDDKTAVMRRAGRQRMLGLVVNKGRNVPRSEYDELRATLWNAARFGAESQRRGIEGDFAAHLLGRIEWVGAANAERRARLRALFDRVDWPALDSHGPAV